MERIFFLTPHDEVFFRPLRELIFHVMVACHELLGHGSGRLLMEKSPHSCNFDLNELPESPISKQPIKSWYKPGQTWSSVFGNISTAYEECRADAIALFLVCDKDLLAIFGYDGNTSPTASDGDWPCLV